MGAPAETGTAAVSTTTRRPGADTRVSLPSASNPIGELGDLGTGGDTGEAEVPKRPAAPRRSAAVAASRPRPSGVACACIRAMSWRLLLDPFWVDRRAN